MSENAVFISVVVCTLDRADDLLRALRYFLDETYAPFEVIVVDQSDRLDERVSAFLSDNPAVFRLIRQKEKSLPKSRNIGIEAARGEIIVFVDDDVEILPGFLAAHARAFNNPGVWGSTGPTFSPDEPRIPEEERDISWMPGCNMVIRRSALEHVGLFDPVFEVHCDDAEISHRIKLAGGRLRYVPDAQMIHHQRQTGGTRTDAVSSAAYIRKYVRCAVYFEMLLGDTAEHKTGILRLFRRLIFSRHGYQLGRVGLRQSFAFLRGVIDARRAFGSRS